MTTVPSYLIFVAANRPSRKANPPRHPLAADASHIQITDTELKEPAVTKVPYACRVHVLTVVRWTDVHPVYTFQVARPLNNAVTATTTRSVSLLRGPSDQQLLGAVKGNIFFSEPPKLPTAPF